jgi:hypothetical protein
MRGVPQGGRLAWAIEYLYSRLDEAVIIEDMAAQVGMSRAVPHRRLDLVGDAQLFCQNRFFSSKLILTAVNWSADEQKDSQPANENGKSRQSEEPHHSCRHGLGTCCGGSDIF